MALLPLVPSVNPLGKRLCPSKSDEAFVIPLHHWWFPATGIKHK